MAISDQAFWSRKITFALLGQDGNSDVVREFDSDLSVEFDVQKTRSAEPNKADIKLFNLSPATRNQIAGFSGGTAKGEFTKIRLAAGYAPNGKDNSEVIFEGYIRRFWHAKEDTDWVTYITAGDGDLDYRNVTVNRSFGKGTPYSDIVRYILSRMPDVGAGDMSGLSEMSVTDTGYTLAGWGKRFLDEIARKHDLRWSIQDGKMEVVSNSKVSESVTIQRLRPAQYNAACELVGGSGMVGIPVVTEYGITVKSLMLPAIRPNAIIQVESLTRDASDEKALLTETEAGAGRYRVNAARYQGSNFGNDYYVTADCQAVKDGEVVRPDHKGHAADERYGDAGLGVCTTDIEELKDWLTTEALVPSLSNNERALIIRNYKDDAGNLMAASFCVEHNTLTEEKLVEFFSTISTEFFTYHNGQDLAINSWIHRKKIMRSRSMFSSEILSINERYSITLLALQVLHRGIFHTPNNNGSGLLSYNYIGEWKNGWHKFTKVKILLDTDGRHSAFNGYADIQERAIELYRSAFSKPIISKWGHKTFIEILAHEIAHFVYDTITPTYDASYNSNIPVRADSYSDDELHFVIATESKGLLNYAGITCSDLGSFGAQYACDFDSEEEEQDAFMDYLESIGVRRTASDQNFKAARIANRWSDLPKFVQSPSFTEGVGRYPGNGIDAIYKAFSKRYGNHDVNRRLVNSGFHIATEEPRYGIFVHHDFYDPTRITEVVPHNTTEVAGLNDDVLKSTFRCDIPHWKDSCGPIGITIDWDQPDTCAAPPDDE